MTKSNLGASVRDRLLNKARAEKLDYNLLLTRWPIRKALACSGRELRLVSEGVGGFRIWQHCYTYPLSGCLTISEQGGRVTSWSN